MANSKKAQQQPAPPEPMKEVALRMAVALYKEIEDYRWGNRLPSNTEAIRKLLRIGLDAEK